MADQIYKVKDPTGAIREIKGPAGATDEQVIAQAKALFSGSAGGDPLSVPDAQPKGAKPAPEKEKSFADSLSEKARGGIDAVLGMAGGAAGDLAGRGAALLTSMAPSNFRDPVEGQKEAARVGEKVRSKFSYEPAAGSTGPEYLSKFGEFLDSTRLAGLGPVFGMEAAAMGPTAARQAVGAGKKGSETVAEAANKPLQKAKPIPASTWAGELTGGEIAEVEQKKATPKITPAQQQALDTLERFSKDPSAISRAPTTRLLAGSRPTLAETTENPGLAQLQRAQQSKSPDLASLLSERKADRLGARTGAMETVAGSEGELAYLKEARTAIAEPLYKKARETPIDPKRITPELRADMDELLQRPTVQEARAEAIKKARDSGQVLSEQDMGSMSGMHWMKRAIDDKISVAKRAGNDDQARIFLGIQEKLIDTMQKLSPDYAKAMAEYQAASKPINRIEVGQYLRDKLFPASNQYGGSGTTVNQFTKALEHPDQVAKLATGFSGAKMANILTEGEITMLKDLARDVVRERNVEGAARISGSPTAQLTATQERLNGLLDKLEKVPTKFVSGPAKLANWGLEKSRAKDAAAYEGELNKMLMDPAYARSVAALRDYAKNGVQDVFKPSGFSNMLEGTRP